MSLAFFHASMLGFNIQSIGFSSFGMLQFSDWLDDRKYDKNQSLKEVVIKRNRLIFWRTSLRGTNSRRWREPMLAEHTQWGWQQVPTVTDYKASDVIWPESFHSRFQRKWPIFSASHNAHSVHSINFSTNFRIKHVIEMSYPCLTPDKRFVGKVKFCTNFNYVEYIVNLIVPTPDHWLGLVLIPRLSFR